MAATKPAAPKTPRTRTRRQTKVEIPGQDEVSEPGAPIDAVIEQKAIEGAPANVALGAGTPGDDNADITDIIADEAVKGNVTVQHRKAPQIGDHWAGMILSEEGWLAEETYNRLYGKDK